ncbi:hypothetical protein C5B42_04935 [Candidatus Cerribacteria bacterium 'Amazon FNV 2010 28 9']|uniref:PIG-L family deacetylase n=1 Tax=Candidatus Cerribacteria bacterium 'Amazon FNV 2010 28 9' TaxID=2081795 RepID=A0A317JPA2_9BACT|nr:MAG: hypothetical protein C5B42_04935 [Candidatus Cerribacteria bacterium 'Amazon FNV 2010 28 9']
MTYLFFFAHPDDESVACAATMHALVQNGDRVIVVLATDGAAGEMSLKAQKDLEHHKSIANLRREEAKKAQETIGYHELRFLNFQDGQITNEMVWKSLKESCITMIDEYKPDVVITFDHSGWYFHLDHVGVSIATTLAVQQATHRTDAFLIVHMSVKQGKWKYIFPDILPITHTVNATAYKAMKLLTLDAHLSQDLEIIRKKVMEEANHLELYQLAFATEKGKKLLHDHPVFHTVTK